MAQETQDIINSCEGDVIIDTDILTYKIWSDVKYGQTDSWINQHLTSPRDKLYLLCYPDVDWEPDPLRENPHDRLALFSDYEQLLMALKLDYYIICGKNSRLSHSLEIATNYFNF